MPRWWNGRHARLKTSCFGVPVQVRGGVPITKASVKPRPVLRCTPFCPGGGMADTQGREPCASAYRFESGSGYQITCRRELGGASNARLSWFSSLPRSCAQPGLLGAANRTYGETTVSPSYQGGLAHFGRAEASQVSGDEFESRILHQQRRRSPPYCGCSSADRAAGLYPACREFESLQPRQ